MSFLHRFSLKQRNATLKTTELVVICSYSCAIIGDFIQFERLTRESRTSGYQICMIYLCRSSWRPGRIINKDVEIAEISTNKSESDESNNDDEKQYFIRLGSKN